MTHLQQQVALTPDNLLAVRMLARLLATCPQADLRDGKRAVELAERALQLAKDPEWGLLFAAAAAYAEVGEFEKAIPLARQALAAAPADEKEQLGKSVAVIESRKPYRFEPKPAVQESGRDESSDGRP